MSDFISKLHTLLIQLLSAGCTSYEDNDKIFHLLNTLPMDCHPFRISMANTKSLTFEEVSSRLILMYRSSLQGNQHQGEHELPSIRRMESLGSGYIISDVGTPGMTLAATASSRGTPQRNARCRLPGSIERARGLPMQVRPLRGWPRSTHRIMQNPLPLWIDGLLIAEPHTI